jgi:mannose-6-phosphate isomerase-like protein (cupin superfamily)
MTLVINKTDLPGDAISRSFQGQQYNNATVSFLIVETQPGNGPRLHSHPYEEIFIVQEGQAIFTVGDKTLDITAGQIVVAPANVPHKFINSGTGPLRQIDIHPSPRFITTWLEEE